MSLDPDHRERMEAAAKQQNRSGLPKPYPLRIELHADHVFAGPACDEPFSRSAPPRLTDAQLAAADRAALALLDASRGELVRTTHKLGYRYARPSSAGVVV